MVSVGPIPFARLVSELGLCDVWRNRHLDGKYYSCYSASPRGLTRIDQCLSDPLALSMVHQVEYVPRNISEHSLLRVRISIAGITGTKLWKVNPFWFSLFPTADSLPAESQTFL